MENSTNLNLAVIVRIVRINLKKIMLSTMLFAILSVLYALSLPNVYSSKVKLVASSSEGEGGLSSIASRYSGLASMAGINLGSGKTNVIKHAEEFAKSWHFLDAFVNKHDLKALFTAVESWDPLSNTLVYDDDIYDVQQDTWKVGSRYFWSDPASFEPTSFKTYEEIRKRFISISYEEDIGIFEITATHFSPHIAHEITKLLVTDINEHFRQKDQIEAKESINFLRAKLDNTDNVELQEIFYNMLESQTQTLMLTEIKEEYLLKTLVPAKISHPSEKSGPKRAIICVIGTLLGGLLVTFWTIASGLNRISRSEDLKNVNEIA